MKGLLKNEKGSVLIITAIAMVVMIGFTALAVDGGYLYYKRTRLQDIADAMALASVVELVEGSGGENNRKKQAFIMAQEYATKNGLNVISSNNSNYTGQIDYDSQTGQMTAEFPGEDLNRVKVNLGVAAKLYLAQVLGFNSTPINVTATAVMGYVDSIEGNLLPVGILGTIEDGILDNDFPWIPEALTAGSGEGDTGSYGWLNYSGDVNEIDDFLEYGYDGVVQVEDEVVVKQGVVVAYSSAIDNRINSCTLDISPIQTYTIPDTYPEDELSETQLAELTAVQDINKGVIIPHLDEHETAGTTCPRLVYLPVMDNINQNEINTVIGFAKYFILGYESGTLNGIFIPDTVSDAEISPSSIGTVFVPPKLDE